MAGAERRDTSGSDGGDPRALERLLGVPEMAWFRERVRGRILAGTGAEDAGIELTGVVRLNAPSAEQRAAAVRLVGPPKRPGFAVSLDLADVETILRRGPWPAGLADAVVTLTGPVVDRRAERDRETARWEGVYAGLAEACHRYPDLDAWWRTWCAGGALKRLAAAEANRVGAASGLAVAERLVVNLAHILEQLPEPNVPLAVFARRVVGDAHGLDDARPLGRLAVAAVDTAFGNNADRQFSRRDAWASAGIVVSNVSSTVLSLGVDGILPIDGRTTLKSATATALTAMRAARSPILLTLDQVRSGGIASLPADRTIHVCENPTVVEVVAGAWTERTEASGENPVLVCTSGQASTAVIELLEVLTADGAGCRYHGDFDWAGLRIAQALRSRIPWEPWRFTAADYRVGLRRGASSLGLAGAPTQTPWDPRLARTMEGEGVAVEEEAVADLLAADVLAPAWSRSAASGLNER